MKWLAAGSVGALLAVATPARAADAPPVNPETLPAIREPAPRPDPAARVQTRFAQKDHRVLLFGGAEYMARGDFYNSPGLRLGAAYNFRESLAIELQLSHYWSSLNNTGERVAAELGAVPDSRPPTWLALLGARYSLGYGKLMFGGLRAVIHLEPQAFAHFGIHDYGGDVQPTGDAGLGLLVFLTPRLFARADIAVTLERESRSGQAVAVWGALPALVLGGLL